jgi:putative sterol carrier protein
VPRFLTTDWVAGFNAALAGVALPAPGPDAGLAAVDGRFTVAQEVRGTPDGDVLLVLHTEGGSMTLEVGPLAEMTDRAGSIDRAEVTIALDYADAAALARGELSPADALSGGRIRVRGDLSVLAAGQELLRAARVHTRVLDADTTF